jgi:hypothetical protein
MARTKQQQSSAVTDLTIYNSGTYANDRYPSHSIYAITLRGYVFLTGNEFTNGYMPGSPESNHLRWFNGRVVTSGDAKGYRDYRRILRLARKQNVTMEVID